MLGLLLVLVVAVSAAGAPLLAPYSPYEQDIRARLKPPGWRGPDGGIRLLGTDGLGRDVLSRIMYGARVSLLVALATVPISLLLGVTLGITAGYAGGQVDRVIMRLVDIQLAIPFILLTLAVIAVLGPSLPNLILTLGITGWLTYARVIRAETMSIRRLEYVMAARALGATSWRIVTRHIAPNVLSSVVVLATLQVPGIVIGEASLSFLGLGVQPPNPTWGGMLSEGRQYVWTAWWLVTFPGLALTLAVLGVNLLGDWMRDMFDPRLRRQLGSKW
jgi:peptide/nickel transport system permease protein